MYIILNLKKVVWIKNLKNFTRLYLKEPTIFKTTKSCYSSFFFSFFFLFFCKFLTGKHLIYLNVFSNVKNIIFIKSYSYKNEIIK